ncbi:MAG: hypothetical protein DWI24_02470 [Planctomycetota bacterium]|nr:MAG: hypothetical protein DWI24_02470 [Planctomycetota bacterium]
MATLSSLAYKRHGNVRDLQPIRWNWLVSRRDAMIDGVLGGRKPVQRKGMPRRQPWSVMAGCLHDDGRPGVSIRCTRPQLDALQDLQPPHFRSSDATPVQASLSLRIFPQVGRPQGVMFAQIGSMVVMPILGMFALLIGSGLLAAQPAAGPENPSTRLVQKSYGGIASPVTEALSLESDQPTILEFSATWCGPCTEMKPQVDALKAKNYPIRVLDVDREQDLAHSFRVSSIPAFVFVSPDGKVLGRSEGLQDASKIATQFRRIKADWQSSKAKADKSSLAANDIPDNDTSDKAARETPENDGDPGETEDSPREAAHPKPWQTVVRIVVHGGGVMGFGSGTIIESTDEHSIILTCAHIFKLENARNQAKPGDFPRQVTVDLFDGKLTGPNGQTVTTSVKNIPARVIDYDFQTDVGLIAIAPGYKLPASPVVPEKWKPSPKMMMFTAGCSGGKDATVWNTEVVNPESKMLLNRQPYEAIECLHEPIQGRSGGGLYTMDGYVAGVCDMAVVGGKRGLYATPKSIHSLLARNDMGRMYTRQLQDFDKGQMLARYDGSSRRPPQRSVRAQSDDEVTIPPPGILGVTDPNSSGLPPVGSMAMVDAMTETPLRTIPNSGTAWNGGTRFRKIADSESAQNGFTIPKAKGAKSTSSELADSDLVPVNQLASAAGSDPSPADQASDTTKSRMKKVSQPEVSVADQSDPGKQESRPSNASRPKVDRQPPRVRLMPVQGLEKSNEGIWRSNAPSSSID